MVLVRYLAAVKSMLKIGGASNGSWDMTTVDGCFFQTLTGRCPRSQLESGQPLARQRRSRQCNYGVECTNIWYGSLEGFCLIHPRKDKTNRITSKSRQRNYVRPRAEIFRHRGTPHVAPFKPW